MKAKPIQYYFQHSSKQDRALLDRFVEYWDALPQDLHPTALCGFLRTYFFYRGETDMAA
jgi:hypothetical protein